MTLDLDGSRGPDVLGFVGWLFAALAFAACAVLAAVLAPRPLAAAARRVGETTGAFVYGMVPLPVFFVLCVVLAVTIIRDTAPSVARTGLPGRPICRGTGSGILPGHENTDVHGPIQGGQRHGRPGGSPHPRGHFLNPLTWET